MQEDSYEKGQKSKSTKVENGMGMRNKWIFLFTRCYDPVVSKLEATRRQRLKMKLIFLASKELSWLWNLGFHFPKLDYHQWLKYIYIPFGKSRYLEEFSRLVLSKQSVDQRRYCPEICVRQVVANCCSCKLFSQICKILDPSFNLLPQIWPRVDSVFLKLS